jgi:3-hydroxyisobutyrate dehydrogenase
MTATRLPGGLCTAEPETTVAVLGTGIMGSAVARDMAAAGLCTKVWDRSPKATVALGAAGASKRERNHEPGRGGAGGG